MTDLKSMEKLKLILNELECLFSDELPKDELKLLKKCSKLVDKKLKENNTEFEDSEMELLALSYSIIQNYL